MHCVHRLSDVAEKVLNVLGGFFIGVCTLLAVIEVICRYLLRFTHSWAGEIIIYGVIYGVFLIAGPTLKRGLHINIDLLTNRLQQRPRRVMDFIATAAGLLTSIFLTYTGVKYVIYLRAVGVTSTSSLQAPMYLLLLIFPLGMFLLAFFYFEQFILLFKPTEKKDSTTLPYTYKGEL